VFHSIACRGIETAAEMNSPPDFILCHLLGNFFWLQAAFTRRVKSRFTGITGYMLVSAGKYIEVFF